MFATTNEVADLTGCLVDDLAVRRAQAIVEVASGKPESMVSRDDDKHWLMYATAWQAAYMADSDVFQQANVERVTQDESSVVIGDRLYALSPLVVEALKRLSWHNSKSIKTKPWDFKRTRLPSWWTW